MENRRSVVAVSRRAGRTRKSAPPPTQRELFALFLPLALSGIFFPLASPVINAALARTAAPALALAAYGVARSLSNSFLSPLYGLRQMTTALVRDREMARHVRNCSWALGGVSAGCLLLVCVPSLYHPLVERLLGIPGKIARTGWPVLVVMACFPLLVVGRGYCQGILVKYGKAGPVGVGALGYLAGTAIIMWTGVYWTEMEGALLAGLALGGGQVIYLLLVWWPTRELFRQRIPESSDEVEERQKSGKYVFFFFLPLAISAVLGAVVEPVIQAGMARSPRPEVSLAAYPVCNSLIWLGGTPLWNVQQVVIAKVRDSASFTVVRRFVLSLSLLLVLVMGLIALPPVADFIFGTLIGVSGGVKELSIQGFRWLVISPLLMGGRSLYYGTLISQDATGPIRSTALVRIVVLLVVLSGGVAHGEIDGLLVAIWATLLSSVAEVIALHWHARRVVRKWTG